MSPVAGRMRWSDKGGAKVRCSGGKGAQEEASNRGASNYLDSGAEHGHRALEQATLQTSYILHCWGEKSHPATITLHTHLVGERCSEQAWSGISNNINAIFYS